MQRKTCIGTVVLMVLACVYFVLLAQSGTPTTEDDTVRTLILGLTNRQQNLQTLQGMATAETQYEADSFAVLRGLDAKSGPPPQTLNYSPKGLQRIAFWLDLAGNRWRIEVAELTSTGFNEWGFLTNHAMDQDEAALPVLVEVSNGSTITRWDMSFARAKVSQFDPSLPKGGGYTHWRLAKYLLLGRAYWKPEDFSFVAQEKVADVGCYKVIRRHGSESSHGTTLVWIAPDKGFALVKYVASSVVKGDPKRGSRTEVTATSLVRVADGIWLPTEARINRYGYVPQRDEAMCETHIVHFSDLKANGAIPNFCFHAHLPLGTIVNEEGRARLIGHTQATLADFKKNPTPPEYNKAYLHPLSGDEFHTTE